MEKDSMLSLPHGLLSTHKEFGTEILLSELNQVWKVEYCLISFTWKILIINKWNRREMVGNGEINIWDVGEGCRKGDG